MLTRITCSVLFFFFNYYYLLLADLRPFPLKDSSSSRPMSQTGPPARNGSSRQHSHSVSLGAVNMHNRVTRRKSMTSSAANNSTAAAALVAALKESGESLPTSTPAPPPPAASTSHRRRLSSVKKGMEPHSMTAGSALGSSIARARAGSNIDHGYARKVSPNASGGNQGGSAPVSTKNRGRRASEGSHLIRGEGKRVPVEIKCER